MPVNSMMTNLLFKWTDVPPVESENIQQASSVKYILLPRLITGQSCQCKNSHDVNVMTTQMNSGCPVRFSDPSDRLLLHTVPLRSCNSVVDSWLSLHDWITGEPENFSSHLMNDGHAAKPWSKEFRKQVLPRFNRPGTIPDREHKSLLDTAL